MLKLQYLGSGGQSASFRVVAFPFAGGSSLSYQGLAGSEPVDVEWVAIDLPGRGELYHAAPYADWGTLVDDLIDEICASDDGKPFCLLGHSFGALLAFEVARGLVRRSGPRPLAVFLSACPAPHRVPESLGGTRISALPDGEFIDAISRWGYFPDDQLPDPAHIDYLNHALRQDLRLYESYGLADAAALPLEIPGVVLGGNADRSVAPEALQEWSRYFRQGAEFEQFDGDHFYWLADAAQQAFAASVASRARSFLAARDVSVVAGAETLFPDYVRLAGRHPDAGNWFSDHSVIAAIQAQVAGLPDAVAIDDGERQWTFAEVAAAAAELSASLSEAGVRPGDVVGVFQPHGGAYLLAILGAWSVGAPVCLLERSWPDSLLGEFIASCGVRQLLTVSPLLERAELLLPSPQCTAVDIVTRTCSDRAWNPLPFDPEAIAFVSMTSGSTGKPKAVLTTHGGTSYCFRARDWLYPYRGDEREGINVFFAWECLRPLMHGHPAVMIPDETLLDPPKLLNFLAQSRITRLVVTPSLLEGLIDYPGHAAKFAATTAHMAAWFLMGEVVPERLIDKAAACFPEGVRLVNAYSTWESLDVSYADLLPRAGGESGVPAGFPLPGCVFAVLDEAGQPVPSGVAGELYIGTPALGPGYLGDPQRTRERFVSPPPAAFERFGHFDAVYRTGDSARIRTDGQLAILGRMDSTVKIRGFKVSLHAVERVLDETEGVSKSLVLPVLDPQTQQPASLVAYVVGAAGRPTETTLARLRQRVRADLPDYAIPSHLIGLDAFPLRGNGSRKLDKAALPAPTDATALEQAEPAADAATGSSLERQLAAIWGEVLGLPVVRRADHFFRIGGNSLSAAKVAGLLTQRLGLNVNVVDLYQHSTVAELASHCAQQTRADSALPAGRSGKRWAHAERAAVAIVGMAGRFPGAASIAAFWQNLVDGVDSLRHFSRDELLAKGLDPAQLDHPNWVPVGQVVDDADQFDAPFFGIGQREAVLMDPQHRLFMEVAWLALEQAGYARSDNPYRERTGVFAACGIDGYLVHHLQGGGLKTPLDPGRLLLTEIGNEKDYIATRVAYQLDLGGPAITVATACSSALVAVVQAVEAIVSGQCDMALAGASALTFPHFGFCYEDGLVGSVDGRVRPFDAAASGTLFGDAVGAVVLKRLDLAEADGDLILAKLTGVGLSNDGRLKAGYTAPSAQAQRRCITEAMDMAGARAEQISYVECHATATLIGDAIELKGLAEAFDQTRGDAAPAGGSCVLGSVKGNLGHANCAAGITGLIKTVLQLQHRTLVPTVNLDVLNPKLVPYVEHGGSPFRIQRELSAWDVARPELQLPRRAGVSSFGIGGTNAHVVLEEASSSAPATADGMIRPLHLLTVSARSHTALVRALHDLADHLANAPAAEIPASAYTLHVAREAHPLRTALSVPADPSTAAALLRRRAAELGDELPRAQSGATVAFCFSGQGSQHAGMGRALYGVDGGANAEAGRFRRHFDAACAALAPWLGDDIARQILAADDAAMQRPVLTQAGLFALEYALAHVLLDYGIRPVAVAGHSVGQYAAAEVAGVLTLEQAAQLVAVRALATEALAGFSGAGGEPATGGMLSVAGDEQQIRGWLAGREDLWLAVHNAPGVLVLAGLQPALAAAVTALSALGCTCRRVPVSHPFHTPLMQPVAEALARAGVAGRLPSLPMACNVSGGWLGEAVTTPGYWAHHLLAPVQWADNVAALLRWQPDVIVEVGPGSVLRSLINKCLQTAAPATAAASPPPRLANLLPRAGRDSDEVHHLSDVLGELWCAGVAIDWPAYHAGEVALPGQPLRRCVLPGYPFDRLSYWTRPEASIYVPAAVETAAAPAAPLAAAAPGRWLRQLQPRPQARMKLYCLPYAGGSSLSFAAWAGAAPDWLEVVAVEWPGRNGRAAEPLAQSDQDDLQARQALAEAIRADAGGRPVAFCGLSYGAAAAVELLCGPLQEWSRTGQVKGLVLVGRSPVLELPAAEVDPDQFLLVPVELQQDALWKQVFYPILKADLEADARTARRMAAWWAAQGRRPLLALPLQIHGGLDDPAFDGRAADAWAPLSSVPLRERYVYPGGHEFMLECMPQILGRVTQWLKPHRLPLAASAAPVCTLGWQPLRALAAEGAVPWRDCRAGDEAAVLAWLEPRLRNPADRAALLVRCGPEGRQGAAASAAFLKLWQGLMQLECQGRLTLLLPADADSGPLAGLARVAGAEYAPLGVQLLLADDHPDLRPAENDAGWADRSTRQAVASGEPWLRASRGRLFAPRLQSFTAPGLPSGLLGETGGNYLITGAAGGIGRALIDWLIDEQEVPPQHIIALQRRPSAGHRGVPVVVADLAVPAMLDCALAGIARVEGIFHLAGVLDDGIVASLDQQRLERVLAPKLGLAALLQHTPRWQTAWTIAFSSTSALLGVPGQGNYAAANAWLDHLALWPAPACRMPIISIQWGSWATVGMSTRGDKALQRARQDGERPLATDRALAALGVVLASVLGQAPAGGVFTVCDVDWPASPWAALPLLAGLSTPPPLAPELPAPAGTMSGQPAPPTADGAAPDPIRAFLSEFVTHWDERLDLGALGLDSLDIAQVRNGFFRRFEQQIPLSMLASPDVKLGELARRLQQMVATSAVAV